MNPLWLYNFEENSLAPDYNEISPVVVVVVVEMNII